MTPARSRSGPDFLGIGAQKSGTSWLHTHLARHPQLWLPPEKELHFFDARLDGTPPLWRRVTGGGDEGVRWRRQVRRQVSRLRRRELHGSDAGWYLRFFLGSADLAWYRALFPTDPDIVAGEFTPDYGIVDDERVALVREELADDLRLILVLRSPIERLWSHAKMEERLLGSDVEATALEMLTRARPRRHTDYLATIRRWTDHFPADQVWVGFMEDIAFSPEAVLDSVCAFLGVDPPDAWAGARRAVHVGGHARMPGPVATALAEALGDELAAVADRLGGPARWWDFAGGRLRDAPPADDLAYPLWESALWDEWLAAGGSDLSDLHSGPLPDVLGAS